jgi:DNA repair protein RadC
MGAVSVSQLPDLATEADNQLIADALRALEQRARYNPVNFCSPSDVKDYCRLRIGSLEHEVFVVLFVDAQNRLISCDEMFRGTISQTAVYPREVVKAALKHNAAGVIFCHNHPSGLAEQSRADELLTHTLRSALALIDVRVLDHVIVTASSAITFTERGLL